MTFTNATTPITADLGIGRAFPIVASLAATAVHASLARGEARKGYRMMLESDDPVRDFGVSREEVRKALNGCGYWN